jgi:Protein of unknown function (DUF2442)
MKITRAEPLSDFRLRLEFDNGESGNVDLSSYVGRGVFAAWQQPGTFAQVRVTPYGTVEWPGDLDLCPDALYLQMTGKKTEEVFPAIQSRLSNA